MCALRQSVTVVAGLIAALLADDPSDDDYGPGYGTEWLYFVAENGSICVMNFSSIPDDTRGLLIGDAYFTLHTRQNLDDPEPLNVADNSSVNSKYFNPSNPVKVVTHGWLSSDSTEWLQNIKDAYLSKYDYNVITVDWSEISLNPTYVWPALSTRYVGKRVAKMLSALENTYGTEHRNIHLIGHSLGAQVMGYAGMFSQERISRITGLDPARPLFELPYMPANFRLEKSDAQFVDIIHTCGGVYGYRSSHGHADFYPNNGKPNQPGCQGSHVVLDGCSHGRACEFYGESIESDVGFISYPCDSWNQFQKGDCMSNSTSMGDPVSLESSGDYYLRTRDHPKYAMGDQDNE